MSTTPDSGHLNSHHRNTLQEIFRHPTSHNVDWRDVLSLLGAVGTVETRHDGRLIVRLGTETETLDRPQDKDVDVQMVVDLRRMLRNAGYAPAADGDKGTAPDA
jgi:hypothetical protein